MKQPHVLLWVCPILLVAPLAAQPSIGGGTCSTATLTGNYAISINGRGVTTQVLVTLPSFAGSGANVTPSGKLSSAMQAVGTVNFDGINKAAFTLVEDTNQASGIALTWSGTYTVQANCVAVVTVTTGGTATLNVLPYNNGQSFQLTGGDATYAYSGTGNTQATGCSTATVVGEYDVTLGQGYLLSGTAVSGAATGLGVNFFDGAGNVSADDSTSANGLLFGITGSATATATGTYTLGSNCVGSGTLTSAAGTLNFHFSVYTGDNTLSQAAFVTVASPTPLLLSSGTVIWIGQAPTAGALLFRAQHESGGTLATTFQPAHRKGERS